MRPLVLRLPKIDTLGEIPWLNLSLHEIGMSHSQSPKHLFQILPAPCLMGRLHQPAIHTTRAIYSTKSVPWLSYIYPDSLNDPVCVHILLAERLAEHGVPGFIGQSSNLSYSLWTLCVRSSLSVLLSANLIITVEYPRAYMRSSHLSWPVTAVAKSAKVTALSPHHLLQVNCRP